jgi:hypothetical protein
VVGKDHQYGVDGTIRHARGQVIERQHAVDGFHWRGSSVGGSGNGAGVDKAGDGGVGMGAAVIAGTNEL